MKYALLIGINYIGQNGQLSGCINDIRNVSRVLKNKYNYNKIILLDDRIGGNNHPTKTNIIAHLETLVQESKHYNEIWIHYSGHGSHVYDYSGDEDDNRDEVIIPVDYKDNGVISDDLLNIYIKQINPTCKVTCIMDCCHSGTILDLPYKLNNDNQWDKVGNSLNPHELPDICMISGCKDDQTSADAYINTDWQGAMTWSLLKVLKDNNYNLSYRRLVNEMRLLLKDSKYSQIPQMTNSFEMDIINKFGTELVTHDDVIVVDNIPHTPIKLGSCCIL
jgi:hypothetical protein